MAATQHSDTIVALATPQGIGAIAVIRLSGDDAIAITQSVFKGKDLREQPSHTIHFGTIRDEDRIIDEVLVSVFKAPNSFTTENAVEISCHGSPLIVKEIIKVLLKQGARLAAPGEFTKRAHGLVVRGLWENRILASIPRRGNARGARKSRPGGRLFDLDRLGAG